MVAKAGRRTLPGDASQQDAPRQAFFYVRRGLRLQLQIDLHELVLLSHRVSSGPFIRVVLGLFRGTIMLGIPGCFLVLRYSIRVQYCLGESPFKTEAGSGQGAMAKTAMKYMGYLRNNRNG